MKTGLGVLGASRAGPISTFDLRIKRAVEQQAILHFLVARPTADRVQSGPGCPRPIPGINEPILGVFEKSRLFGVPPTGPKGASTSLPAIIDLM
jgi:hypothetical protein